MTQSTSAEVHDTIAAANQKFMAAFSRSDAAALAALYTENGQLLPTHSDFVTGRRAIQTFWQDRMDLGVQAVKLEIVEVEGHGDTVNEVGKYIIQGQEGQVMDTGKYVVIWKQIEGQWRLHRDIWNSSMPRPGQ
jgi:uncharacterized protein (TIGR02246 family)